MPGPQTLRTTLATGACFVLALAAACRGSEPPSTLVGGYTFSRDFEDERRVLRIETSSEFLAECMSIDLPIEGGVGWRETELDPSTHRALLDLVVDESRVPQYVIDTQASADAETFVCKQKRDGKQFCYTPQVVVTGVSPPWRFALQPDAELSTESEELIERFMSAHEVCWNGRTAASESASAE